MPSFPLCARTQVDGSRFFRRALTVQQSHSSVAALKHSGLALDAAMIEAIAARTSSSQAAPIISQRVDHALYVSCVRFALRLAADMLASGRHVSMLGLEVALGGVRRGCSLLLGSSRCWASR